jgi:hypothetical protein
MLIEVSNGEIIDKLTILALKLKYINDKEKLANIRKEHDILTEAAKKIEINTEHELYIQMMVVNEKLWEIEDKIRDCEKNKDFGKDFIELARSVYVVNDERSKIKRKINHLTGSDLIEEKSYKEY